MNCVGYDTSIGALPKAQISLYRVSLQVHSALAAIQYDRGHTLKVRLNSKCYKGFFELYRCFANDVQKAVDDATLSLRNHCTPSLPV